MTKTATIVNGKALAEAQFAELRERISRLGVIPKLTVVTTQSASENAFVRAKKRAGDGIGLNVELAIFADDISVGAFRKFLNDTVKESNSDGIIVQLPLPEQLESSRHALLRVIPEEMDADCLSERWIGRMLSGRTTLVFKNGETSLLPPVAASVAHVLESADVAVHGRRALVVGWGDLVGKPVGTWLLAQKATVTVATASEDNLATLTSDADIIVSGAGKPGLISGDMVKEGVVVIDAGTSDDGGALVGDVDREGVAQKAALLSPSPGGIGPLTLAFLLKNVVGIAEARRA